MPGEQLAFFAIFLAACIVLASERLFGILTLLLPGVALAALPGWPEPYFFAGICLAMI